MPVRFRPVPPAFAPSVLQLGKPAFTRKLPRRNEVKVGLLCRRLTQLYSVFMPNDGPLHNIVSLKEERRLFLVLLFTSVIMIAEVVGGYISGSLALLADAGHMFTDVAALLLSWLAMRLGRKEPDNQRTFGYQRLKILAAYTNAVLLFFLAGTIVVEAIHRLGKPEPVQGEIMLGVALLGFFTNLISFFVLKGGAHAHHDHSLSHAHAHDHSHESGAHSHHHTHQPVRDLNVQSALIHVLTDMLGSAAAVIAAIIILTTGWTPIDPILSIFVCLLIVIYACGLCKKTVHILIEGTPDSKLPEKIRTAILAEIKGVKDVHHIHIWSLTENQPIATLDAIIDETTDHQTALCAIQRLLETRFGLNHVTIQIEKGPCFQL